LRFSKKVAVPIEGLQAHGLLIRVLVRIDSRLRRRLESWVEGKAVDWSV